MVGLFGGDITISTPLLPMKALTLQGSYVGSLAEMKELLALIKRTGLPGPAGRNAAICRCGCCALRAARR